MEIEILAGTPPGGGQDRAARALAAALSGDTTVVNIPGRGGSNAWDELARRVGDQGSVAISSPTLILNTALGVSEIDDRDLTPIAQLCTEYLAFAVAVDAPWTTPADLARALATGRVPVSLAVARGNVNHIALGAILSEAGAPPTGVEPRVFDSARDAVADVGAGDAGVVVVSAASVVPELVSGALRVVAVTAPERLAAPFDQVPTWQESGFQATSGPGAAWWLPQASRQTISPGSARPWPRPCEPPIGNPPLSATYGCPPTSGPTRLDGSWPASATSSPRR